MDKVVKKFFNPRKEIIMLVTLRHMPERVLYGKEMRMRLRMTA